MAWKTWKYDQKWPCQFVSFRVGWCLEQLPRVPQWHPLGLRGGVVALLKTCRVVLGTYANVSIRVISCRCEAIFWCSCFLSILLNLTLASSDSRFPIYAMVWWSNYIISSLRIHNYWSDSPCWLTGAIATPLKKPWFQNHSDTLWKLLVYCLSLVMFICLYFKTESCHPIESHFIMDMSLPGISQNAENPSRLQPQT